MQKGQRYARDTHSQTDRYTHREIEIVCEIERERERERERQKKHHHFTIQQQENNKKESTHSHTRRHNQQMQKQRQKFQLNIQFAHYTNAIYASENQLLPKRFIHRLYFSPTNGIELQEAEQPEYQINVQCV